MASVAIFGATTWGNTLGRLLADKGIAVSIWARAESKAEELRREQQDRLSKTGLPDCLSFTSNANEALSAAEFAIWAVPAQSMRETVKRVGDRFGKSAILVNVAKGLEADTGKRMSEVIAEEVNSVPPERVCVLSGPNLSKEIDQGLPATSVVAGQDMDVVKKIKNLLDAPGFSVLASDDIIGVELCGALKNVIALGAGMLDGLELGNNAKAAFITIGWGEVVSLGTALGAREHTFYGLAGLGDLIATGNSPLSRNHYVGYELGKGRSLDNITASMANVAEGIDTAMAVHRLTGKLGLELPTIELIYGVLYESLSPVAISNWLNSGLRTESST